MACHCPGGGVSGEQHRIAGRPDCTVVLRPYSAPPFEEPGRLHTPGAMRQHSGRFGHASEGSHREVGLCHRHHHFSRLCGVTSASSRPLPKRTCLQKEKCTGVIWKLSSGRRLQTGAGRMTSHAAAFSEPDSGSPVRHAMPVFGLSVSEFARQAHHKNGLSFARIRRCSLARRIAAPGAGSQNPALKRQKARKRQSLISLLTQASASPGPATGLMKIPASGRWPAGR